MSRNLITAALFLSVSLISIGCGNDRRHASDDPAAILHRPPFAAISDSIMSFPTQADLYLRRAMLLSQNKQQDLATADFKKAWDLTGDENIELEYISNLLLTDHAGLAEQLLVTGARKHPDNTEFTRRLAEVYLQKGATDRALLQYNNMLARDSADFEAWFDKGNLLTRLGDTTAGIAALERSFQIMPINYSGLALAGLYAARKNPRALVICDELLARDSGAVQTEPIYMKGVYYAETKQYDSAVRQFDLCISRDWKMTDAYIEKGILFYQQKLTDSALKTFSLAATVSNTDADAYYWMGRCYEAKGDKQQAATNYERAYALDNSFVEARDRLQQVTK